MGATTATPADDNLFKVFDESEALYLMEEQAQTFHNTVAFDVHEFPCTQRHPNRSGVPHHMSKKLDEEDWGMLKRILKYLKGTQGLKLTLRIVDMPIAKWWVHIPYTVYED